MLATRYWNDADYRGLLGQDAESMPLGIAAGKLDVLLQANGGWVFWRNISGNDDGSYQNRAINPREIASAWLKEASEQRDLAEAMRQTGAGTWSFHLRRHEPTGLRQVQAAIRRDLAALRGEWPTLSAAVMDTIDDD